MEKLFDAEAMHLPARPSTHVASCYIRNHRRLISLRYTAYGTCAGGESAGADQTCAPEQSLVMAASPGLELSLSLFARCIISGLWGRHAAGVEFIDANRGGPGVRLRENKPG
jgi:hypothetical protein